LRSSRAGAAAILAAVLVACSGGDPAGHAQEPPAAPADAVHAAPSHRSFPDAASALVALLDEQRPKAVGFGEFHQTVGTVAVRSTLERFTGSLLPVIAARTSDLVVETWVSQGDCGETERAVVAQVEAVSRRPDRTEDENLALIRRAKELGIRPHILEMECADYDRVHGVDGGLDYVAMLELVAGRIEEVVATALAARRPEEDARKMLAIYCGAVHNDLAPAPDWEAFSFGPGLRERIGGRYLEVDLYVPEFVEASESAKEEPWYQLVVSLASGRAPVDQAAHPVRRRVAREARHLAGPVGAGHEERVGPRVIERDDAAGVLGAEPRDLQRHVCALAGGDAVEAADAREIGVQREPVGDPVGARAGHDARSPRVDAIIASLHQHRERACEAGGAVPAQDPGEGGPPPDHDQAPAQGHEIDELLQASGGEAGGRVVAQDERPVIPRQRVRADAGLRGQVVESDPVVREHAREVGRGPGQGGISQVEDPSA